MSVDPPDQQIPNFPSSQLSNLFHSPEEMSQTNNNLSNLPNQINSSLNQNISNINASNNNFLQNFPPDDELDYLFDNYNLNNNIYPYEEEVNESEKLKIKEDENTGV